MRPIKSKPSHFPLSNMYCRDGQSRMLLTQERVDVHHSNYLVSGTKTTHILRTIIQRYPKILTPGTTPAYAANPDLLSKFDIVDQKIGFRPSRIGGVRVEVEHGRKC